MRGAALSELAGALAEFARRGFVRTREIRLPHPEIPQLTRVLVRRMDSEYSRVLAE